MRLSGSSSGSAGPPDDEVEADQGGGEAVERLEDVGPALVADGEPAEAGKPGERAFDHPPVPTQALATLDPASRDARDDAAPAAGAAVVVPLVGVQLGRALARAPRALPDWRYRVEDRLQHGAVVDVGRRQLQDEGDAAGVDQDVALAARLAAVGRVWAGEFAPLLAGTLALSIEQRDQSIAFASP